MARDKNEPVAYMQDGAEFYNATDGSLLFRYEEGGVLDFDIKAAKRAEQAFFEWAEENDLEVYKEKTL